MSCHPAKTTHSVIFLVERARGGDRSAFDALAAIHHSEVFGICLKWTGNVADAEDLAQDVMVKAFTRIHQIDDPARFGAWLARIAVNTCKNWLARDRKETLPLEEARLEERRSASASLDEASDVREALACLPPHLRLALKLFYLHGFTQKELASLWHMPESTVKSRLDMGRRMMRKELVKMGLLPEAQSLDKGEIIPRLDVPGASGERPQSLYKEEIILPDARIAVANPDRKAAKELCGILKAEGYTCNAITRGELIVERLRRLMPGILILHAPFEEIDEFEILRAMKIAPRLREIAVVLLVPKERATQDHVFKGWQAGVDCFLTKPYDISELKKFVRMIDNANKAVVYRTLAIEHAWHRDTPRVLYCLTQAVNLGGKTSVDAIKEDTAFNYIRHTNEFRLIIEGMPSSGG